MKLGLKNVKQDKVWLSLVPGLYLSFFCTLLLVCYLFISRFVSSGLVSEGNHIVTSHHHPILRDLPGLLAGASGKLKIVTNV